MRAAIIIPLIAAGAISAYAQAPQHRPDIKPAVTCSLEYDKNAEWYNRLEAVEAFGRCKNPAPADVKLLKQVRKDADWRVRDLAKELIQSYDDAHSFALASPAREENEQKIRLSIGAVPDLGYNSKDIWYDRMDNLENSVCNGKPSPSAMTGLARIAKDDDHPIIKRLATSMLQSAKNAKNYSQVQGVRCGNYRR